MITQKPDTNKKAHQKDDAATRIKLHKQTIQKGTPLALIKEKELDINKTVMDAQKKADQKVIAARKKSEQIRQEALDKAPVEANKYLEKEIAKANIEAKEIEKSVPSETADVNKKGLKNFEEAINKVMQMILP